MANVYVNNSGVQRIGRNGRVYSGDGFNQNNPFQGGSGTVKHWEHGSITDLEERTVIVEFIQEFNRKPTLINLKVYRMIENIPHAGKWIMQDVLHYFDDDEDWSLTIGFSLFIDNSEDLEGVIIDYCFTE